MILRKAYQEVMNHIVVTEEMRGRILNNLQRKEFHPRQTRRLPSLSRYAAIAACLVLLAAGALALPQFHGPVESPSGVQSGIRDITVASSLQELSQLVHFDVDQLTDLPFSVVETKYLAYNGELAEVTYCGETQRLVFRKIIGDADPSGDYTAYSDVFTLGLEDFSVTLKGDSGSYSLAVWQDGGFSYSIQVSTPLSDGEWTGILASVS